MNERAGGGDSASRPAPQRHAICRQIIELRVRDSAGAHHLSADIGALIQNRITPILERCFNALSDPAEVDRIDRLELDLGTLHPARLAEDMAAKVEAGLPDALRRAKPVEMDTRPAEIGAHGSALLLISQFVRTGGLPWWSDGRKLDAIDEAVDAAHRAAPGALAALLRTLAADRRGIERLVRHQSDAGLQRLLPLLAPSAVTVLGQLGPLLAEAPALAGVGKAELRHLLWRETLIAAANSAADDEALLETVLTNVASAAGTTLSILLADLRAASPTRDLVVKVAGLAARVPPALAENAANDTGLAGLFDRLAFRVPALGPVLGQLRPLVARLPAGGRADCMAALEDLLRLGSGAPDAALAPAIDTLVRPFRRSGLVTMAPQQGSNEAWGRLASRAAPEDETACYVENAGLCLLWPFLARFFARLGLLAAEETAFVSDAACCRAVGLLHYLATGEREPPEFWLPLNKVLCGLDLDALELFGPPVTDSEVDESERLLAAAIAHAACLGTISTSGFRGSFLLRRGALTTRDGTWLLRVERQAVDVLLDRFPWKTEWIRLPWMQAALRVEW